MIMNVHDPRHCKNWGDQRNRNHMNRLWLVTLVVLLAQSTWALFGFEPVAIPSNDLGHECNMVTSGNLLALECPNSFKVFDVSSLAGPVEVYATQKAVAQVQPSRLASDPFISFIEAILETQATPSTFAYLKVIDKGGERDLALSFVPNRTLYLGSDLIVRIGADETGLTVFDLGSGSKLSPVISILNQRLIYDFYPLDEQSQAWVIIACSDTPECHTYKLENGSITPQSKRKIEGDDVCGSKVQMTREYVLLECALSNSLTLHRIDADLVVSLQFYSFNGLLTGDATLTQINDDLSIVHFTQKYDWSEGQLYKMTFIDSIQIVKPPGVDQPSIIYTEKHLYYEKHGTSLASWSFEEHIVKEHQTHDLPQTMGDILSFKIASNESTLTIIYKDATEPTADAYAIYQQALCGINAVRRLDYDEPSSQASSCFSYSDGLFVDWVQTARTGLISPAECSKTPTGENANLMQLLRAMSCPNLALTTSTFEAEQFKLTMSHLELDGYSCDGNLVAIGGHCVDCGGVCGQCDFPNTEGMIYGFYLGADQLSGTCIECGPNSTLQSGNCVCQDTFFYNQAENECKSCLPNCLQCSDANSCKVCSPKFKVDDDGTCIQVECDAGSYFDDAAKGCQPCQESCATCDSGDKCKTCPEGFTLGDSVCLQCGSRQTIVGDTCRDCGQACLKCSSIDTCEQCEENAFIGSSGQCECSPGLYMDQIFGTCKDCGSTCATCSSRAKCDTCPEGFELGDTKCLKCSPGQFVQGDSCESCQDLCLSCTDQSQCNVCYENALLQADGTCQCKDGFFFEESSKQCVACGDTCATCINGDKCETCPEGFTLGDTKCLSCASSQTIVGDECVDCRRNCLECASPDQCQSCSDGTQIMSNGKCSCKTGQYLEESSDSCFTCHQSCETCFSGDRCETCPEGFTLGDTICLQCNKNEFIDGDICTNCGSNCLECESGPNQCQICAPTFELKNDGTCSCPIGKYFNSDSNTCESCGETCATCSSPDKCDTCPEGFSLGDTLCLKCNTAEFILGDTCESCGINCLECTFGPNQCEKCAANSELSPDGSCKCSNGFFLDDLSATCQLCHDSCGSCSSADTCDTCKDDSFVKGTDICYQCAVDEYLANDECVSCGEYCAECGTGPGKCTVCENNLTLQDGTCICDSGFYLDKTSKQCVACGDTCATCINGEKCETCPEGFTLGDTKCLSCASSQTIDGDECVDCGRNCLKCNSLDQCLSCSDGTQLLSNGKCSCKTGQYLEESTDSCLTCHETCKTCLSGDKCETCPEGFTLGDTICLKCNTNEFIDGDICTSCGPNCLECDSGPNQCKECAPTFELQSDGTCSCSIGKYFNSDSNTCESCGETCATCSSPDKCDTCPEGFSLGDTLCLACTGGQAIVGDTCSDCGRNCLECSSPDSCLTCSEGTQLLQDGSCSCKQGQYLNINIDSCESCHESCATCLNSAKCETCSDGFTLGDSICLKCNTNEFINGDVCTNCGQSCLECESGPNQCQICAPTFELQSDGTCACQIGKYFNSDSNTCEPCGGTCAICSSSDKCDTCPEGFSLGDTLCISCAEGQAIVGDTCSDCGRNCLECSSPDQCLSCSEGTELLSTGNCSCKIGQYLEESTDKCMTCQESCETCVNGDRCETCPNGFTLGDTICLKCNKNEFINGDSCESCGPLCLECGQNDKDCSKCTEGSQLNSESVCECQEGSYFDDAAKGCQPCQESCATCDGGDKCKTCPEGFTLGDSVCLQCGSRQTIVGDTCRDCGQACLKCSSIDTCEQCEENAFIGSSGQCESVEGFFIDPETNSVRACRSRCSSCENASECKTCQDGSSLEQNGSCSCAIGQYLEESIDTCLSCQESCETCVSGDKCETCPDGFTLGDTICLKCNTNEFINGDSCESCGSNCLECDSGPNQCKECALTFELQSDGTCSCPIGKYFNSDSNTCEPCGETCASCSSPDKCDTCPEGFSLGDTICISCAEGQAIVGDTCSECGRNCLECSSPDQCLICLEGTELLQDGSCSCKQGQFLQQSTQTCESCHESCKTCLSGEKCETCPEGFTLGDTKCLSCTSSQTIVGDECVDCGRNCLECSSPDQCQSCSEGTQLLSTGKCSCQIGQYLDDSTDSCLTCQESCETCVSGDKCDTCPDGFTLGDTICLKCNTNQFIDGDVCSSCGSNCLECDSGPNQCKVCAENSSLTETGTCSCDDGFFLQDGICKACDSDCLTCSKTGQCLTCPDGFTKGDKRCLKCNSNEFIREDECLLCSEEIDSCASCSIGQDSKLACIGCAGDFELDLSGKCVCSTGFFHDTNENKCESCPETCSACTSSTQCTACQNPFDLIINGACLPLTCVDGQYREASSGLCLACSSSCGKCVNSANECTSCPDPATQILTPGATCLTCDKGVELSSQQPTRCQCENGQFFSTDQLACTPCLVNNCKNCGLTGDSCSICADNFELDQTKKQCSCPTELGFFESGDRNCESCMESCESCTDASTCAKCADGSIFGETKCVECQTPGNFVSGNLCIECPQFCADCDAKTGTCLTCDDTFGLQAGICSCPAGTFLDSGKSSFRQLEDDIDLKERMKKRDAKSDDKAKRKRNKNSLQGVKYRCESCAAHCIECVNREQCLKCADGYALAFAGLVCAPKDSGSGDVTDETTGDKNTVVETSSDEKDESILVTSIAMSFAFTVIFLLLVLAVYCFCKKCTEKKTASQQKNKVMTEKELLNGQQYSAGEIGVESLSPSKFVEGIETPQLKKRRPSCHVRADTQVPLQNQENYNTVHGVNCSVEIPDHASMEMTHEKRRHTMISTISVSQRQQLMPDSHRSGTGQRQQLMPDSHRSGTGQRQQLMPDSHRSGTGQRQQLMPDSHRSAHVQHYTTESDNVDNVGPVRIVNQAESPKDASSIDAQNTVERNVRSTSSRMMANPFQINTTQGHRSSFVAIGTSGPQGEIRSEALSRFESPGRQVRFSESLENKTLIEQAAELLKENNVETSDEVLARLNKLEQMSDSKEAFLDSVTNLMDELLDKRVINSDQKRQVQSALDRIRKDTLISKSPANIRFRKFVASDKADSEMTAGRTPQDSHSQRPLVKTPALKNVSSSRLLNAKSSIRATEENKSMYHHIDRTPQTDNRSRGDGKYRTYSHAMGRLVASLNESQSQQAQSQDKSERRRRCASHISMHSKKSQVRSIKMDDPADDISDDAYRMFIQEEPMTAKTNQTVIPIKATQDHVIGDYEQAPIPVNLPVSPQNEPPRKTTVGLKSNEELISKQKSVIIPPLVLRPPLVQETPHSQATAPVQAPQPDNAMLSPEKFESGAKMISTGQFPSPVAPVQQKPNENYDFGMIVDNSIQTQPRKEHDREQQQAYRQNCDKNERISFAAESAEDYMMRGLNRMSVATTNFAKTSTQSPSSTMKKLHEPVQGKPSIQGETDAPSQNGTDAASQSIKNDFVEAHKLPTIYSKLEETSNDVTMDQHQDEPASVENQNNSRDEKDDKKNLVFDMEEESKGPLRHTLQGVMENARKAATEEDEVIKPAYQQSVAMLESESLWNRLAIGTGKRNKGNISSSIGERKSTVHSKGARNKSPFNSRPQKLTLQQIHTPNSIFNSSKKQAIQKEMAVANIMPRTRAGNFPRAKTNNKPAGNKTANRSKDSRGNVMKTAHNFESIQSYGKRTVSRKSNDSTISHDQGRVPSVSTNLGFGFTQQHSMVNSYKRTSEVNKKDGSHLGEHGVNKSEFSNSGILCYLGSASAEINVNSVDDKGSNGKQSPRNGRQSPPKNVSAAHQDKFKKAAKSIKLQSTLNEQLHRTIGRLAQASPEGGKKLKGSKKGSRTRK